MRDEHIRIFQHYWPGIAANEYLYWLTITYVLWPAFLIFALLYAVFGKGNEVATFIQSQIEFWPRAIYILVVCCAMYALVYFGPRGK